MRSLAAKASNSVGLARWWTLEDLQQALDRLGLVLTLAPTNGQVKATLLDCGGYAYEANDATIPAAINNAMRKFESAWMVTKRDDEEDEKS